MSSLPLVTLQFTPEKYNLTPLHFPSSHTHIPMQYTLTQMHFTPLPLSLNPRSFMTSLIFTTPKHVLFLTSLNPSFTYSYRDRTSFLQPFPDILFLTLQTLLSFQLWYRVLRFMIVRNKYFKQNLIGFSIPCYRV